MINNARRTRLKLTLFFGVMLGVLTYLAMDKNMDAAVGVGMGGISAALLYYQRVETQRPSIRKDNGLDTNQIL